MLMAVGALLQFRTALRRQQQWVVATGKVVGSEEDEGAQYPCIEFRDRAGQRVRFRSDSGRGVSPYRMGTEVEVLYDPQHPDNAEVRSFSALWFPAILTAILAIGFIVVPWWQG